MVEVQIFGLRSCQATRAAERFFKERRIRIHFVDLKQKPMSPGEIRRFAEKFGVNALLDVEGKPYLDAGLKHMRLDPAGLLAKIERDPRLLRTPLVRSGQRLSLGSDPAAWKALAEA